MKYRNGKPTASDIEEKLREVAICKLCSFLRIGPAIETSIPFDLICYSDRAQFHMEKCQPINFRGIGKDADQLEAELKFCLKTLHFFNICHRDIKPDNILMLNNPKRFVLSDFGLSMFVTESVGEKSSVYYEGTPKYMTKELKDIRQEERGEADLYLADLFALQTSVSEIRKEQINYVTSKDCQPVFNSDLYFSSFGPTTS